MTKRGDMSGFYSNLLSRNSAFGGGAAVPQPASAAPPPRAPEAVAGAGPAADATAPAARPQPPAASGAAEPELAGAVVTAQPVAMEGQPRGGGEGEEAAQQAAERVLDHVGPREAAGEPAMAAAAAPVLAAPERATEDAVASARERYLARKRAKTAE